jgi:hypothetical protein
MSPVELIAEYLGWSILAGGLGVGVMTLALWTITRSGLTNARMVVAVGSLITRSYERAVLVGSFAHTAAGMSFGLIYTLLLMAIGHPGLVPNIFFGGLIGVVHGLIVALMLVAAVAEEHPLPEFQQSGFSVAIAHWVVHVVYGLVVGTVIGISGLTTIKV